MLRRTRMLVALTLIGFVSPLPGAAVALHVLLDAHHVHAPDLDPEAGLHGHAHPSGTPAHDHGLLAPPVHVRAHETAAGAFAVTASVHPLPVLTSRNGHCGRREAVARASPIAPLGSILRI